ncbi:hypothetical protein N656DRAFT_778619 [Canariomyces notabilis]|uniref:Uncharacterized protein n=1 Tax=Canariomyces notabilis TaxID=2074819 RepID=A0AAN6TER9_9PEZI|nr:hypothetical protein N656DRAFT_778619 [Canariomyces arenarius]
MFASSLFGMNIDLLKDNPDWRWYVLFGGTFLMITFVGWLIFRINPVCARLEDGRGAFVLTNDTAYRRTS